MKEQVNEFGVDNYLVWKENRTTEEIRPDCIAHQYHARIAFAVVQVCGIYCRHCFCKGLIVDQGLQLNFNVEEDRTWIAEHPEIRDVLITGGDPLLLSDDKLEYLITKPREIPHIEKIRIGSRLSIDLPHRKRSRASTGFQFG